MSQKRRPPAFWFRKEKKCQGKESIDVKKLIVQRIL